MEIQKLFFRLLVKASIELGIGCLVKPKLGELAYMFGISNELWVVLIMFALGVIGLYLSEKTTLGIKFDELISSIFFGRYLNLEEAATLLYKTWKPDDYHILDIRSFEKNGLDQILQNTNNPKINTENQEEYRIPQLIHYLMQMFKEGKISLYGEKHPDLRKEIIALRDIKNLSDDFKSLFIDEMHRYIHYTNICCKRKELLNFLRQRNRLPILQQLR